MASQFARTSSGLWQGVADAIDPPTREPVEAMEDPEPAVRAGPTSGHSAPEGAMLVPLDTWTRILDQIGNVHEAGQQLAEARERAARAETENEFLRAQITDLKAKTRAPRPAEGSQEPTVPATPPSASETRTGRRVRQARERASRWLSP